MPDAPGLRSGIYRILSDQYICRQRRHALRLAEVQAHRPACSRPGDISRPRENAECVAHNLVQHLVMQHGRNLVNAGGVKRRNHGLWLHIGKQGNLCALVIRQGGRPDTAECPAEYQSGVALLLNAASVWFSTHLP